ncbi:MULTISPECIES: methyltransferase [Bacillus cereus group]|nr:methyltransferase [Bacillus thuringiensis]
MCMKKFNEVVATHLNLESVLMPIGDGMTISKVKK